MANTEIINTLRMVRDAQSDLVALLDTNSLTTHERQIAETALDDLRSLDNTLVASHLRDCIGNLEKSAAAITETIDTGHGSLARFTKVADSLMKVAKAVDALSKATSILLKAGLL